LEGFVLFLHIVVCLLLIIVVLLQSGKSADLAGAFGGYGSQSTFGPRGAATILSKMTTVLAVLFMVLTLLLMIIASRKAGVRSVLGKEGAPQEQTSGAVSTPEEKQETTPAAEEKPAEKPDTEKKDEGQDDGAQSPDAK
jgi:preprotein translocase subunit SecG